MESSNQTTCDSPANGYGRGSSNLETAQAAMRQRQAEARKNTSARIPGEIMAGKMRRAILKLAREEKTPAVVRLKCYLVLHEIYSRQQTRDRSADRETAEALRQLMESDAPRTRAN